MDQYSTQIKMIGSFKEYTSVMMRSHIQTILTLVQKKKIWFLKHCEKSSSERRTFMRNHISDQVRSSTPFSYNLSVGSETPGSKRVRKKYKLGRKKPELAT